ncbi:MAG: SGNH/GDSL hydrolase family protein [Prevotella sp.]|nr:SGNH/GDSL hydrolase family protein [Prevotella sp.]
MKNTSKRIWLVIVFLFVACLLFVSYELADYYSFAKEVVIKYNNTKQKGDTLRVIIIGDSWAAYHSDYNCQLETILEDSLNKPVKVQSNGSVGAKTIAVYANMFDSISSSGTKKLIDMLPDYAVISTGINDAVAKMGTKNYCHHYRFILRNLLSAGIKPIVLEMPLVDYKAVYQRESVIANFRHQLSSWLTDAPMWDFEKYKQDLRSMISQEGFEGKILLVSDSEWNPKGYADPRKLYLDDHIHLNERGYSLLDSCIASHIFEDIQAIHDFQ